MITANMVRRLVQNATATPGNAVAAAPYSTACQDQWIRHMLSLTLNNLGQSIQTIILYQGDALSPTRTTLDMWTLPASNNPRFFQGTLEVPLYTIRPTTGTTTASGNNFYFKMLPGTARARVSFRFWDEW